MKLTAIIFFITILVNTCYYGIYQFGVVLAKYDSEKAIQQLENKNRLLQFKVSLQDAKKYSDNEIWYQNQLFDIAKREVNQDSLCLYLYHDAGEQNFINAITDFFRVENISSVPRDSKGFYLKPAQQLKDQTLQRFSWLLANLIYFTRQAGIGPGNQPISERIAEVLTPPPRHLSL